MCWQCTCIVANSGDSQATTCMWFYQKDHNNEEETLYCDDSSYVGMHWVQLYQYIVVTGVHAAAL